MNEKKSVCLCIFHERTFKDKKWAGNEQRALGMGKKRLGKKGP